MARMRQQSSPLSLFPSLGDENALSNAFPPGKGSSAVRGKLNQGPAGLLGQGGLGGFANGKLPPSKASRADKSIGVYREDSGAGEEKGSGVKIRKPRLALQNITNATPRHSGGGLGSSAGKTSQKGLTTLNSRKGGLGTKKGVESLQMNLGPTFERQNISVAAEVPIASGAATLKPRHGTGNIVADARRDSTFSSAHMEPQNEVDADAARLDALAEKYAKDGIESRYGLSGYEIDAMLEAQEDEAIRKKVDAVRNLRMDFPPFLRPVLEDDWPEQGQLAPEPIESKEQPTDLQESLISWLESTDLDDLNPSLTDDILRWEDLLLE